MSSQSKLEPGFFERLGDLFSSFTEGVMNFITRLIGGSPSERRTKQLGYYRPKHAEAHTAIPGSVLDRVNRLEDQMKALSDDELKALTPKFKEDLQDINNRGFAEALDNIGRYDPNVFVQQVKQLVPLLPKE